MKINTSLFASVFGLLICLCSPVMAANAILVWPVYQTIEADQTGSALWLENRGESNVVLQIRVMAWKQQNQEEVYAEQQNVVASPPFATVAPGERQLIRLMRFNEVPPGKQDAYRIIIDEIPMANNAPTPNSTGLRLQMRYLLPLFVSGTGYGHKSAVTKNATRVLLHVRH
jgi:fimbrial chaperone protein